MRRRTGVHHPACCGLVSGREIELVHIEPAKPVQNAHVESSHGKLRDECLNASCFANVFEVRRRIAAWRKECNEQWPHSSLGYRTPAEFAAAYAARAIAVETPTVLANVVFGSIGVGIREEALQAEATAGPKSVRNWLNIV